MMRREFLTTGLGLAGTLLAPAVAAAVRPSKYRAIAFDAFPVFDPRPIAARCEALFPGRGSELVGMWRTRQFEYAWLRAVANRYADFERVTDNSLTFAAKALDLEMTAGETRAIVASPFRARGLAGCDTGIDEAQRCRLAPRLPVELHARHAERLHQIRRPGWRVRPRSEH